MKWEKTPLIESPWLEQIEGLGKIDFLAMKNQIKSGEMTLWKLSPPAEGLVVTHPEDGVLFIYYLHGRGLFGSLKMKDMLDTARDEGLAGVRCWVHSKAKQRLMSRVGFRLIGPAPKGSAMVMEI